jgi:hypothetical protein
MGFKAGYGDPGIHDAREPGLSCQGETLGWDDCYHATEQGVVDTALLATKLHTPPRRPNLVLDDNHVIESQPVDRALAFLNGAMGLNLWPANVAVLEARTEGRPARAKSSRSAGLSKILVRGQEILAGL